ncbi:MAG TPA: methyl-accepting chemotaxis protein [Prolixibacteraceae bacterium]|nr:methyl-accepting chemotaxis protein [Prolixibacteraceae bacterium]
MRFRNRFILLFSIIAITFALIGAYTFISFQKIRKISETESNVQNLKSLTLELKNHENKYLTWDLASKRYFKIGKSQNINNFNQAVNEALVITNNLQSTPFIKEINASSKIENTRKKLTDYNKQFEKFQSKKKEFGFKDWGMVGKMRDAIHNVEHEIDSMNIPALNVHMLMLRRHEKDYLLRRDISYKEKFEKEIFTFEQSLKFAQIAPTKKKELSNLLDTYKDTFFKLIEADKQIGLTQNDGLTASLNQLSQKTTSAVTALNQLITAKTEQYINKTISLLIIFIVICTIISIALALFIMYGTLKTLGGEPEEVALIAKNVAKGNLKMDVEDSKEYRGMMKSVVKMTERLNEIINGIYNNADHLAKTSNQYADSSKKISEGAYNQATSIDEISSVIEEISQNISQNTQNARDTNSNAEDVILAINDVKKQTDKTLETGKLIDEKVQIINTISNQTTILALNAAVEAARAGKNGQGFHVIAEEVKRLAQISKDAAKEINQHTTNNTIQTKKMAAMVGNILDPINKTSQYVKNITLSSEEMESGTQQVNNAVYELYNISQENAAASQEMAAGSNELEKQAQSLIEMVSFFKTSQNSSASIKKKKKKKKVVKLWKKQNSPQLIRV